VGVKDLTVRTTSAAFGDWLAEAVAPHVVEPPEHDRAAYSIVVGERGAVGRPVHALYRGATEILRTTDLTRIAASLLGELDTYSLADRDDAVYVAASLVSVDGRAVLCPGFLHPIFGRMGRRAIRAGVVPGPAAAVSIDLATGVASEPASAFEPAPRAYEELKRLVPDGGDGPGPSAGPSPVAAVVLFGSGPGEPTPPTRAETLRELAERSLNLAAVGGPGLIALSRLVGGAVCLRSAWVGGDGWLEVLGEAAKRTQPGRVPGIEAFPPLRGTR
jgi:hypothetical protein